MGAPALLEYKVIEAIEDLLDREWSVYDKDEYISGYRQSLIDLSKDLELDVNE